MKRATLIGLVGRHCHLCDRPIGKTGHASVDHLVPISKGGQKGWPNVALAHKSCNVLRGNLPVEGARAMIRHRLGLAALASPAPPDVPQ